MSYRYQTAIEAVAKTWLLCRGLQKGLRRVVGWVTLANVAVYPRSGRTSMGVVDAPDPYTHAFRKEPVSLKCHDLQVDEIVGVSSEDPEYQVAMLTGVRGSGTTVMVANVESELQCGPSWIVVDVDPERDILQMLAEDLSNRAQLRQLFRDTKINLSFLGLGPEIDGCFP